jgi:hypothetical protein
VKNRFCLSFMIGWLVFPATLGAESPDWKKLTAIATRHRVPMPPKKARLVLANTQGRIVLGNRSTSRDPRIYSPAFLLEEKADGSVVFLRGLERQTLKKLSQREPPWREFSLKKVKPRLGGHVANFDYLSAFVCAVQVAARGDHTRAQGIWKRFAAAKWWTEGEFGDDIRGQLKDPALLFARCIFDHLRKRLLQGPRNWPDVRGRLKALFKEFPKLKTVRRRRLFNNLTTTIHAIPPPRHSTEAFLVALSRTSCDLGRVGLFREGDKGGAEVPVRAIIFRGFQAIPHLIALLNDRRITVHEIPRFNKAPARIQRLGELADHMLRELTGGDIASGIATQDAGAWRAWWRKARGTREVDFFAAAVFRHKGEQITSVNEGPAAILAHKYPDQLPGLLENFSKKASADAEPFYLAKAIAVSRLPKSRRLTLLSEFARGGSLEHKRCVLQVLARFDPHQCIQILKPLLRKFPKDAKEAYWTCPQAGFTHVVMQLEDDGIWREFLRAAKRCRVGLRLEILSPMDYLYIGKKNRQRRLAFLAAFLEDKAIRKMAGEGGKFDGPCAAFTIPRIAVRDFAAWTIASIFDLKEKPDEFWKASQWRKLRAKVQKKLAGERLPKLE